MEEIIINTDVISLDQLLKWAGIVDTGGQAKLLSEDGLIKLNGKIIYERRKKIYPGDIVEITEVGVWKVVRK